MQATLAAGKTLEGHSAGARDEKLAAYAALGVTSCHEPITADEVLARLRLGIHVMAREGNVRRDLETIAEVREKGVDLRRLTIASDGVDPKTLIEDGYMERLVRKAIEYGFNPIEADSDDDPQRGGAFSYRSLGGWPGARTVCGYGRHSQSGGDPC